MDKAQAFLPQKQETTDNQHRQHGKTELIDTFLSLTSCRLHTLRACVAIHKPNLPDKKLMSTKKQVAFASLPGDCQVSRQALSHKRPIGSQATNRARRMWLLLLHNPSFYTQKGPLIRICSWPSFAALMRNGLTRRFPTVSSRLNGERRHSCNRTSTSQGLLI